MSIHYCIARAILWIFLHLRYRIRIYGEDNIPKTNYILAANHYSLVDPLFLAISVHDELHFIAKAELFHNKIFSLFLRSLNAFPVERGNFDLSAVRSAVEILKSGNRLVIFPEGTRVKERKRSNIKEGVGLIATMANVDIVPVSIQQYPGIRPKIEINFKPIISMEAVESIKNKQDRRKKISDEVYLGIYGKEGMDQ